MVSPFCVLFVPTPVSCLRDEVRDILELRKAVKQEAGELELQLTDLVHRYDDSFKMVGYTDTPLTVDYINEK